MFKIEDQGDYIDEETVKLFESFTDFNLTQGYRSFLLQYNGGRPVPNCFNFFQEKRVHLLIVSLVLIVVIQMIW